MEIYVVTTIGDVVERQFCDGYDCIDVRFAGFYTDEDVAIKTVENCSSVHLGKCKYAVVQLVDEGLFGYNCDCMWFEYDEVNDSFVRCAKPFYDPFFDVCSVG